MSDQKLKIAVFIDFDNVEIGVKTTLGLQFDIGAVLEAIKERGEVITKVAYGDWKRSGDYGRAMSQHAVRLVQRVMTPGGDKNGADINLALDALEMAFTHDHINAFVIVGGDSDFITLVEKLKQYDRKVFVVGGRAFTSQVMQKNCTEFIAYENVVPDRPRKQPDRAADRPRSAGAERALGSTAPIEQAVPLVKRALKVLVDREVSPQLGLLKSTLLQLDSSFSERDYGVGTFRDFADRLAKHGVVTLKHQGRSTLVELVEDGAPEPVISVEDPVRNQETARQASRELLEQPDSGPGLAELSEEKPEGRRPKAEDQKADTNGHEPKSLGDGVALVRRVLADPPSPPRWPMYPRQFKQYLRAAQPDFDERRYGSIADLMRACQKDGILRLERDRQGGLRVFASGGSSRASVPHGWGLVTGARDGESLDVAASETAPSIEETAIAAEMPQVIAEPERSATIEDATSAAPKAKRSTRARKAAPAGEKRKTTPRKRKTAS